jgi:murein endopeptidase
MTITLGSAYEPSVKDNGDLPKTSNGTGTVASVQLLTATAATLAMMQSPAQGPPVPDVPTPVPPVAEAREASQSRALGRPSNGRLQGGVPFPPEGDAFFTWDPILKRSPNRVWRRYATVGTVSRVLKVLAEFRAANPTAPRIGVGDLSRPTGGVFDRRFGGLGHASHQNGLDVDIYYARNDRLEIGPRTAGQVDRALAQDLVDRFARAGAVYVFVGPNLGLRRIRRSVQTLVHHDDHLHVRFGS